MEESACFPCRPFSSLVISCNTVIPLSCCVVGQKGEKTDTDRLHGTSIPLENTG